MVAIISVNGEVVEACHNNPGFQMANIQCTPGLKIYITNVSVGTKWVRCDSHLCGYHAITFDHLFFMNISNSCDGQTQCMVSATELYVLSKIEPFIFHKCGNNTPLYNERNKVEVQYICSGKFVTLSLQTLFLVRSNYEPSNDNFT